MMRYSREEMLSNSGARADELVELENRRILVPNRSWRLFGKSEEFFTSGQLEVLRLIVKTRRMIEANSRSVPPTNPISEKSVD